MNLVEAYNRVIATLKPQRQGTCGLYSFWYATILLREISTTHHRIVYPRKCEGQAGTDDSLRKFAKTLGSAQGEVLTLEEMSGIISHFGYYFSLLEALPEAREEFIRNHLGASHPVLIPYRFGHTARGPISTLEAGGAHWSLIIHEDTVNSEYHCLNPHDPNRIWRYLRTACLSSNSFVDSEQYARYWEKTGSARAGGSIAPLTGNPWWWQWKYDIVGGRKRCGRTGQQALANGLIAVL